MIDLILERVRQAQMQPSFDIKRTFEMNGHTFSLSEPQVKKGVMIALIRDEDHDNPLAIFSKVEHTVDCVFWKMATMNSSDTDFHLEGGVWTMYSGVLRTRTPLDADLLQAMQKASQAYIEAFGIGVSKQ